MAPRVNPMSGKASAQFGGRWNPAESWTTLYLANSVETLIAELLRQAILLAVEPEALLPREVFRFKVKLSRCIDLRPDESRERAGLQDSNIGGIDRIACQNVGVAAHYVGTEAILAPSATGVGDIVAVFLDKQLGGSSITFEPETVWTELPTLEAGPD